MYNDIKTIEEKEQDFMQNLRDFVDKEVAEKLSKEVTSCIMEQVKHNMKTIEERPQDNGEPTE